MKRTLPALAHFGTVAAIVLALGGCDQSHSPTDAGGTDAGGDAGRDGGSPIVDAGGRDGGGAACSGSEGDLLGPPVGFSGAVADTPTEATVTSVAEGELRLDVAGTALTYRFEGLSTEGVAVGAPAQIHRDPTWEVVDVGAIGFRVMRYGGFVGGSIIGTPLTPPNGPTVTLVPYCSFLDPSGGSCGQPARDVQLYALELPDGRRLATQEGATLDGAEIFHGGSAQYPGYGSDMCVLEAGFGSRTSMRVPLGSF